VEVNTEENTVLEGENRGLIEEIIEEDIIDVGMM
jgi:hypothetical protein